jgi:hypothetical protein
MKKAPGLATGGSVLLFAGYFLGAVPGIFPISSFRLMPLTPSTTAGSCAMMSIPSIVSYDDPAPPAPFEMIVILSVRPRGSAIALASSGSFSMNICAMAASV